MRACAGGEIYNMELALEVTVTEESVVGLNTETIGIGLGRSGTLDDDDDDDDSAGAEGVALMTGADCRKSVVPTATVLLPNNELLVIDGDPCCLVRFLG